MFRRKITPDSSNAMTEKKPPRRFGCAFVIINNLLLLSVIAAFVAVAFLIPAWVQDKVIPGVAAQLGLDGISGHVRRIGIAGADLGQLRFGHESNPAVELSSLRLDYSLTGLLERRLDINTLSLGGLEINCIYADGKFQLKGFDLRQYLAERKAAAVKPKASAPDNKGKWQLNIDKIIVERGLLNLEYATGSILRLPFSLQITPKDRRWEKLELSLRLHPRGEQLRLDAGLDLKTGVVDFKLNSAMALELFADLQRRVDGLELGGRLELECAGRLLLKPSPRLEKLSGNGRILAMRGAYKNISFLNQPSIPPDFSFSGNSTGGELILSNLRVSSGGNALIRKLQLAVTIDKSIRLSGSADCLVSPPPFSELSMTEAIHTLGEFNAEYRHDRSWEASFSGATRKNSPIKLKYATVDSNIDNISWQGSASGSPASWQGKATLDVDNVSATSGNQIINLKHARLNTELSPSGYAAELTLDKPGLATSTMELSIPTASIHARGSWKNCSASLRFEKASLAALDRKLQLNDISAEFPLEFPWNGQGNPGKAEVKQVSWNGVDLGSSSAALSQFASGLGIDGAFLCSILPALELKYQATATIHPSPGFKVKLQIPEYTIGKSFKPAMLIPALDGVSIDGGISANAEITAENGKINSTAQIAVSNSNIDLSSIKIKNLALDINMTDLLKPASKPSQRLSFSSLDAGKVKLTDGKIDFQLESPQSLLVEQCSFSWCGGNLYTHALRILFSKKHYKAVFFCDNLVLSRIINELGIARASGDGSLVGRIPLVYSPEDGINFEEGYLFSTPGQGNQLKLSQTAQLLDGIPKDSAEFAQLDFTVAALQDFDYEWVKLNFSTSGENLKVKIQIDGKPATPLPFKYDDKMNCFVRSPGHSYQFQGIRLDLNSSLPLNRLMEFNKKIQNILGR